MKNLNSIFEVEQAILSEDERLVIINFNHGNEDIPMDKAFEEEVKQCAVVYVVDIDKVPDFNVCTTMFFFHNKNIVVDLGTRNEHKSNWICNNHGQFVDLVRSVYEAARRGRGMLIPPWNYSTRFRHILELFEK